MAKKKRKAPAPTDASTDATASSSTADAAPTESVDDIFAALAKPSKTAKKAATKPTKCEPARRRDDDDAGDDAWRAGGGQTDYYGKQRDPKVHRCVPARPPPPPPSTPVDRRYTPEGLPIYKYFHLGMQQEDGGTPQCPFDCECCF